MSRGRSLYRAAFGGELEAVDEGASLGNSVGDLQYKKQ